MITVNKQEPKAKANLFEAQNLVVSVSKYGGEDNIYIVTGSGDNEGQFAGLRLSGRGSFQYCTDILKSAVEQFHGEVVIKAGE